jgi:hypothetical protein
MNLKTILAKTLSQFAIEVPWLYNGNNRVHVRPFASNDVLVQAVEVLEKEILNEIKKHEVQKQED